ncbi:MAG: hypothetical protein L6R40_006597 [Gallowayella cf. fulva]|nr:MAG: hypothetical protein L6R40_006597 [Xanthomendoza cf. fulva]
MPIISSQPLPRHLGDSNFTVYTRYFSAFPPEFPINFRTIGPRNETSINEYGDYGAHILDAARLQGGDFKTTPDGKTVLIPQPSLDPNDPLNWTHAKKHIMLFVISVVAFMPDFGSSIGIVTLLPQWQKPRNTIQHNLVGNLFCLGAGGLFTVWLSAYFGRLPILFLFTSMALGTSAWCAAATSFESYMAARILNGFFSIVAQAGGLMFVQDVFFFHEHPRKINIWSGAIIVSPYLGPLIAAFIINKMPWPNAFWVNTGLTALFHPIQPRSVLHLIRPPCMFCFAPIIGSLLGALLGHWLHDILARIYTRRHHGTFEPEARLIIIYLASPIMVISILILGFALEHIWHYMVIAVFTAGQVISIMIATVAMNAYLLDAYPEGSGEVGAWIVVGRTLGGFMATYIEIDWVQRNGLVKAFGAQTGITAAAGLIVLFLGVYGKRIRMRQGRMMFAM